MTARDITLEEITTKGNADKAPYSLYGYVITADGTIYGMHERWTHGIILALLYPDLAKANGFETPQRDEGDLDVFRYQQFELDHGYDLPIIRVALSQLLGGTVVSTGSQAPTNAQISALLAALAEQGLTARDTLTGSDDDPTVGELIEDLRQQRIRADEEGNAAAPVVNAPPFADTAENGGAQ